MSDTIPEWHPEGGEVFWSNGRLTLVRHCDNVYEFLCDEIAVMPVDTFDKLTNYMHAEFDPLNQRDNP